MIAVIGDIHGCFHTLTELVSTVKNEYPGVSFFSTGDLVDRGKFSFETIQYIKQNNITFTPGNHDFMFYYYFNYPSSEMSRTWLFNGSTPTLESYSKHRESLKDHLNFIIKFPLFVNHIDCFISHAGVSDFFRKVLSPSPLSDLNKLEKILSESLEDTHGIIWNRDQLLNMGKLQVVGHTRQEKVQFNKKNNSVYIDTSVYTGNKLSCVVIHEGNVIDIISIKTKEIDIK